MFYLLGSILVAILLWLGQYAVGMLVGSYALLFLIITPHSLWLNKYNKSALTILILGGLLLDVFNPWLLPIYSLVNLIAGVIYIEFIESYLSTGNILTKFLNTLIWLTLWRTLYVLIITLGGLLNFLPLPQGGLIFTFWLKWLSGGLIIWLTMELIFVLVNHFLQKSIRYKKYA